MTETTRTRGHITRRRGHVSGGGWTITIIDDQLTITGGTHAGAHGPVTVHAVSFHALLEDLAAVMRRRLPVLHSSDSLRAAWGEALGIENYMGDHPGYFPGSPEHVAYVENRHQPPLAPTDEEQALLQLADKKLGRAIRRDIRKAMKNPGPPLVMVDRDEFFKAAARVLEEVREEAGAAP